MIWYPPRSTRTDQLCPYATLFRSHLATAVQDEVAAGGKDRPRPVRIAAAECFHAEIVAQQQTFEAAVLADYIDDARRCRRRCMRIDLREQDMRGHPQTPVCQHIETPAKRAPQFLERTHAGRH